MIKYLQSEDEFKKEINKDVRVVDFYAEWCGPCKILGQLLDTNDYDVLKVNVDDYNNIALSYGIMSIPTLVIFKKGKEISRNVGSLSKDELDEFLDKCN